MLVEANICPLCLDVFQDSKELLKHVFQTHHVSMQPPCQHKDEAVINKDTNENVRIKTEPLELNESQNEQQSEICDTQENVEAEMKEINGNIEDTETLSNSDIVKDLINDIISQMFKKQKVISKPSISKIDKNYQVKTKRKFKCRKCKQNMDSKVDLMKHIKEHRCPGKTANKLVNMDVTPGNVTAKKPKKSVTNQNEARKLECWKCDSCDKNFVTKELFEDHQCECQEVHQCNLCPMFFNSKKGLKKHKKNKHKCEFCVGTFYTPKGKLKHMSNCHNFKCHNCHQKFSERKDLTDHECESSVTLDVTSKIVPNETVKKPRFNCNFCDKSFGTNVNRNSHILDKHELYCDKCGQCFPSTWKLQEHKTSQHSNRNVAISKSQENVIIRCEFCDEKFTSKFNLKHHMEIVHSKDVGQKSKKRKPESDEKNPDDDKSVKKVKFNV